MMIIDRFEGSFAVIETDGGMMNMERSQLPEDACEGDCLACENGIYSIDRESTELRRSRNASRLRSLLVIDDD